MKLTKNDLKKLEKYISGLRDFVECGRFSFKKEDMKNMAKKLEDAEAVIRSIENSIR